MKNLSLSLGFVLSILLFPPYLLGAQCTIDSDFIDRGERKVFIVCGKAIPANYTLKGPSEANMIVDYEQHLEMCGIGRDEPGIYLVLKAKGDAKTVSLAVLNADTGESVCNALTVTVPDRVHVAKATLNDLADSKLPAKILTIKGDSSQDLSGACKQGLSFPKGKWPALSLLSAREVQDIPSQSRPINKPLACTESSVKALVNVYGQQRYPAKVVISQVASKGQTKEGVAHVTLPRPAWASSMKDEDAKYIDVNGIRTRYFDKGTGEALLLVHGGQAGDGSTAAQKWQQNFDYLSNYFHVYAIDRVGQGYTDNLKSDEDYENYYTIVVNHVYGFMKAVGIEKVHLVGQSQGGWPVTRLALDHPDMVKSVVCQDCGMAPTDPLGRSMPFMMYIMYYVNPREGATHESVKRGTEMWSYTMNNVTDQAAQRSLKISALPKMVEARNQMIKHSMSPAHPSFIALKQKALDEIKEGKLKAPMLVLWGYNDPSMHIDIGIELFKLVSSGSPHAQLYVVNDCGHSPYIEHPELFNRIIVGFSGAYASPPIQ
jgi:2-hydroxy-6-oxo-6-(2'-carboxyphenyl)-hexa-2,4-dienoate hydrolase